MEEKIPFKLEATYPPAGDQPQAIEKLVEGLNEGLAATPARHLRNECGETPANPVI